MSLDDIAREFPSLKPEDYLKTSDEDDGYNCIAWAIEEGKKDNWWSPIKANGYFWPENEVPRGVTVETFINLYKVKGGYELCDNGEREEGFEKLALYQDADGEFSHVARQKADGVWTSKLGVYDDIDHFSPQCLVADYGVIKQYLKRPIRNKSQANI
jgi:hypothetical protein